MSKDIRISKGLDLKLVGASAPEVEGTPVSQTVAVVPENFHGIAPRLRARDGDYLEIGSPVFVSKLNEHISFPSPVSGTVREVRRGDKRVILEVIIESDGQNKNAEFGGIDYVNASREEVIEKLLQGGCWPFIKQRPYDVIANPDETPKHIFISGFYSAPLAPDVDILVQGREEFLQIAVTALSKLTSGQVHLTLDGKKPSQAFSGLQDVVYHNAFGPHPIGNVSTQIRQVSPLNKGERIWTVKPEDLVIIGELIAKGVYNPARIVALSGGALKNPRYVHTQIGQPISSILDGTEMVTDNVRIIQGSAISGVRTEMEEFLGYYTSQLTVLEEGDDYDLFGWNRPQPNKFSVLNAMMFSFLTPNKKYNLNTNTNGEQRAFVLTGIYEKYFPFDIYPMQLLKSCLYEDLDEMENLGIYEVVPEDFALTEFVCVSKIPHQNILREGLDYMIREIG
ncbi:MAG: Na(+)-translocating NADH-quinone reductase subunit A [Weeksellaceae bacterium]|nr:Na(+)-translocating NADH-quinone reductase subunit A [Weeksellaceae bacterium]